MMLYQRSLNCSYEMERPAQLSRSDCTSSVDLPQWVDSATSSQDWYPTEIGNFPLRRSRWWWRIKFTRETKPLSLFKQTRRNISWPSYQQKSIMRFTLCIHIQKSHSNLEEMVIVSAEKFGTIWKQFYQTLWMHLWKNTQLLVNVPYMEEEWSQNM